MLGYELIDIGRSPHLAVLVLKWHLTSLAGIEHANLQLFLQT